MLFFFYRIINLKLVSIVKFKRKYVTIYDIKIRKKVQLKNVDNVIVV